MSETSIRPVIVGSTVWSAALSRSLADRGIAHIFVNSAPGSGTGMAVVRRQSLSRISVKTARKLHPATKLGVTDLLDYDAVESTFSSSRLQDAATQVLIADRLSVMTALLGRDDIETVKARQLRPTNTDHDLRVQIGRDREIETDLLILTGTSDAAAAIQISSGADPEDLDLITEVGWPDHGPDQSSIKFIRGPLLLGGQAAVLNSPSGVFIVMRNSLRSIDQSGLETRDLIQKIIDHPGLGGVLPSTHPGFTANYTMPTRQSPPDFRINNRSLNLSWLAGEMDPFELDRDLAIGTAAGARLATAITTGRVTASTMGSLVRDIRHATEGLVPVLSVLSSSTPEMSDRRADAVFAQLTQIDR